MTSPNGPAAGPNGQQGPSPGKGGRHADDKAGRRSGDKARTEKGQDGRSGQAEPAAGEAGQSPAQDSGAGEAEQGGNDTPAQAWAVARELRNYAPGSFGGGFVAGDSHGVSGGRVGGDVVMGDKVYLGVGGPERLHGSGAVPPAELDRLAEEYHETPTFHEALASLRRERVVVLRGEHGSGRRAAARMLLRRVGARSVRQLAPDAGPVALINEAEPADGYVVCDLPTTRTNPLAQHHLLRCQERQLRLGSHLVVTVENSAVLRDVPSLSWSRPPAAAVLAAHLRRHLDGEAEAARLLELPEVRAFLDVAGRPVGQLADFAAELVRWHRGEISGDVLAHFGRETLQEQVSHWLADPGQELPLRDKAFLLALAMCDEGPYSTAAELGDRLCRRMQAVESPEEDPGLTIFSTSLAGRLELARAERYEENEQTRWGPVPQTMIRFQDPRTPSLLLREAWTGHPAVRAPMSQWLTELARRDDPFVRTRAAAAVATLADHDFSSVMHGLVLGWASHSDYRLCTQAANALALAAYNGTRAVARVLRDLSTDPHPRRRWTAIRGYALAGSVAPQETLDSLEELAWQVPRDETSASAAEGTLPPPRHRVPGHEPPVTDPRGAGGTPPHPASPPPPPSSTRRAVPTAERRADRIGEHAADRRLDRPVITLGEHGDFETERHRELDHLAEAVGVLLLWVPGPVVLRRLATWADHDSVVLRVVAWLALLNAAPRREEPVTDPASWPELLRRYDDESATSPVRAELAALWRCVLRQREATDLAQRRLRDWVLLAERVPDAEPALGRLLAHLVADGTDHDRLSYLLRTMPGEDDGPPPPVAGRLLNHLASASASRRGDTTQRATP